MNVKENSKYSYIKRGGLRHYKECSHFRGTLTLNKRTIIYNLRMYTRSYLLSPP